MCGLEMRAKKQTEPCHVTYCWNVEIEFGIVGFVLVWFFASLGIMEIIKKNLMLGLVIVLTSEKFICVGNL